MTTDLDMVPGLTLDYRHALGAGSWQRTFDFGNGVISRPKLFADRSFSLGVLGLYKRNLR